MDLDELSLLVPVLRPGRDLGLPIGRLIISSMNINVISSSVSSIIISIVPTIIIMLNINIAASMADSKAEKLADAFVTDLA